MKFKAIMQSSRMILLLLLTVICLVSCVTVTNLQDLSVKDNEYIVCGKINILEYEANITKWCNIKFNNYTYVAKLDSLGYFVAKIPENEFLISRFEMKTTEFLLNKKMTSVRFADNSKIYYIGDVTIVMDRRNLSSIEMKGNRFPVYTFADDNRDEMIKYLKSRFTDDFELESRLIDAPPSDSIDLYPSFLEFELTSGRILKGELKFIHKNKLYIDAGRILIIVHKDKLKIIMDNKTDVTESKLLNISKKKTRLPYNDYFEIEEIK